MLLLLASFWLVSCKEITQGKGKAENAVADFHRLFNEQKFKEIYTASHANWKAEESEADFTTLLTAMHRKLGKYVKTSQSSWRMNSINGRTSVVITEQNEFEHGKGAETFVYLVSGSSCSLQNYHLDSRDMMIK